MRVWACVTPDLDVLRIVARLRRVPGQAAVKGLQGRDQYTGVPVTRNSERWAWQIVTACIRKSGRAS